jgi:hypothetical protein
MKYAGLLLLLSIICCTTLIGQYRKSISVKAGDDVAQAYSPNGFYRFPQFTAASLYNLKRKGPSSMLFNYNLFTGRMQFINNEGDTMDMMNPLRFDSMMIGQTIFFYKYEIGYLELIGSTWPIRLLSKTDIKLKTESVGAYEGSNTTSSVDRMKTVVVGTTMYNFKSNENITIKQLVDWYWMGEDGHLMKATKRNLFTLLSPQKARIAEDFIKQHNIKFDREADLIKLLVALR